MTHDEERTAAPDPRQGAANRARHSSYNTCGQHQGISAATTMNGVLLAAMATVLVENSYAQMPGH